MGDWYLYLAVFLGAAVVSRSVFSAGLMHAERRHGWRWAWQAMAAVAAAVWSVAAVEIGRREGAREAVVASPDHTPRTLERTR